jgi:23S rRNA (cytidine1920-2'-O)/16S rRNA (cytidine1409-2'-O)-methyltransferase
VAQQLIEDRRVSVAGAVATKPATQVEESAAVVVREAGTDDAYVSRGAHKLVGALNAFEPRGLVVRGRRALDAGASTGGFTQVLLDRGAASVVAVDVGYGQLAWSLRTDERVDVRERVNIRDLRPDDLPVRPGLVVGDLSFISLALVLPALDRCADPSGDLLLMVKPQFEVGRDRVGSGGVVRDPALRTEAVLRVARAAEVLGWGTSGVVASPLPGPSGNVEYFLWFRRGAPSPDPTEVAAAVEGGPA